MSTDPPSAADGAPASTDDNGATARPRTESFSQKSDNSQTAADFIRDQMQLEADAREAMPYSIEECTKPLGPLRQSVYACLTCNPPPTNTTDPYNPAGVCYSCSVQCHGEHELVEIFQKRNFTCDCGTTRLPKDSPCTLRVNPETNTKGSVHSETPDPNNKYNQNFRNRFCSCEVYYEPMQQKGTMFQCLGLGTHETGGCGEDWYHPVCLVGLGPDWFKNASKKQSASNPSDSTLPAISEVPEQQNGNQEVENDADDDATPPGFPEEDAFDHFICYKCVEANPWIKNYAGASGFLPPVYLRNTTYEAQKASSMSVDADTNPASRKRKAEEEVEASDETKRVKSEPDAPTESNTAPPSNVEPAAEVDKIKSEMKVEDAGGVNAPLITCKKPPPPQDVTTPFSIFLQADFRERLCHCSDCFPTLKPHPQLLEEEEAYEPPLSASGGSDNGDGSRSHGSGSLYERGESALKNVDRVRAIEGVMAYNHMKEKLRPFFQEFAESGRAIGAEDIKAYFAKLRGDEEGMKEAGEAAAKDGDNRKEQSGY